MKKTPRTESNRRKNGVLQELGLSSGSDQIYELLTEHGPQSITDIARSTEQFRPDTYTHIQELTEKGLVKTITHGKRKLYEASSPDLIFSLLKKKEDAVTDHITRLLRVFDRQQDGASIDTFIGKKGIMSLYEIMIKDAKRGAHLLRIESPNNHRIIKEYYPKIYWKRVTYRQGGDMERYVITNEKAITNRVRRINRSQRSVPEKHLPFNFEITTIIVEDKIGFIDHQTEKAFLIRNDRFAEYMSSIFWMLYDRL
jgi:sugar-specific transcriptional regulator TrmB